MATASHKLTQEPADVKSELSLVDGRVYAVQYSGPKHAFITSQDDADAAVVENAALLPPLTWLKVTPTAGEGIYVWADRGGYITVFTNVEPY